MIKNIRWYEKQHGKFSIYISRELLFRSASFGPACVGSVNERDFQWTVEYLFYACDIESVYLVEDWGSIAVLPRVKNDVR